MNIVTTLPIFSCLSVLRHFYSQASQENLARREEETLFFPDISQLHSQPARGPRPQGHMALRLSLCMACEASSPICLPTRPLIRKTGSSSSCFQVLGSISEELQCSDHLACDFTHTCPLHQTAFRPKRVSVENFGNYAQNWMTCCFYTGPQGLPSLNPVFVPK